MCYVAMFRRCGVCDRRGPAGRWRNDLMSTPLRTVFITGSSSGLGRATTKLFASKGWKVMATMRSPGNESELATISNVTLIALDTTDAEQIRNVVQEVIADGGT